MVIADTVAAADTDTVTIAGVMVPAIGTGVAGTDIITVAIGMPSPGGWDFTLRPTMVPTTMPQGDHGIQAAVAVTGQDAVTRTGVGPATIVAA